MIKSYRFRLKGNNEAYLNKAKSAVNFVWNYCNDTAVQYLDKHNRWLSDYDFHYLFKGCSKDLGILFSTMKCVSDRYFISRRNAKQRKLSWRTSKRSLGWVPFKGCAVKLNGDTITYNGFTFRFWKSTDILGKIKVGNFSQDGMGRWYVSLSCELEDIKKSHSGKSVGIDLGLKDIATLSNGTKLNRENITNKYAAKLATAQRARKKKQVAKIHSKIKNSRKDWNHKQTTSIINEFDSVIIGDLSPSKLKKTRMAKSVSDAGWADFKSMLAYKAVALGVEFKEVKENFSTVTCSTCFERTGPRGLSALGVREWTCKCGAAHDRDVNAAKNILRFGHEPPIKGSFQRGAKQ